MPGITAAVEEANLVAAAAAAAAIELRTSFHGVHMVYVVGIVFGGTTVFLACAS